jgi:hypothetical protein
MKTKLFSNILVVLFAIITISWCTYSIYYSIENQPAIAQKSSSSTQPESANKTQLLSAQQSTKPMGVKINSPLSGQEVPVGELNISGTSTDTAATDCNVLVDVNDIKPLQNTTATGFAGQDDYSNWTFTYTKEYHLITEGPNELTAKLSCNENYPNNTTVPMSNFTNGKSKWYSINVTGIAVPSTSEGNQNNTQNQTQPSNISEQNATVSDLQPEMSNQKNILELSNSTQEQKISALDGGGLTTPSRESLSLQDPTSEEDEFDESSSLPHYPEIMEGSDIVERESIPSSDLSTHGALSYNERQPAYGPHEGLQEELQPPLQMSDLPDENDAGTQLMEDIQGMNIDDEESRAVPQEDELHSQTQEAPVQDTNIGPPLQMFNTENHEQAAPDQAQANQIEEEDDSDAVHSANDIYEMITGHIEEEIDTEEIDTEEIDTEEIDTEEIDTEEIDTEEIDTEETPIAQDIQGQNQGNTIAQEIPLVQSYTRNIESALE